MSKDAHTQVLARIATTLDHADQLVTRLRHSSRRETRRENLSENLSENLHDLRVELRRLQAAARLARTVDPDIKNHLERGGIKRVLKATGALRDQEVLKELLPLPRAVRAVQIQNTRISPLKIAQILNQNLPKDLGSVSRRLILEPLLRTSPRKFRKRTAKKIETQLRKLRKEAGKLNEHKTDSRFLHQFRIRAKKLRYSLEHLEPQLGPRFSRLKKTIRKNQEVFGHLHDLDSAQELIRSQDWGRDPEFYRSFLKKMGQKRLKVLQSALQEALRLKKQVDQRLQHP